MKTIFLYLAGIPFLIHAESKDSNFCRNTLSIGVEVFSSPVSMSMMHYKYEQWVANSANEIQSVNNPAGFGVLIQKKIHHFYTGLRVAYTSFNHSESSAFISHYNSNRSQLSLDGKIEQYQLHVAPFVKLIHNFKKLKIGTGLEIPFIYYSKGSISEYRNSITYYGDGPAKNYESWISTEYTTPSGLVKAFMGSLEFTYPISKQIDLGFVLNGGYIQHTFSKPIGLVYTAESKTYNMDGSLYSHAKPDRSEIELQANSNLSGFTRVLPAFRLYYHLN